MDRLTRRELKKDEIRDTLAQLEQFARRNYKEIATVVGMVLVAVGLTVVLKVYAARQEADANAQLATALKTYHAYVGTAAQATPGQATESFPTSQEKYKKALGQFNDVTRKFPRTKAATIARTHAGLCQARLGDQAGAIKTLQEASRASDRNLSSLALLALAGELAQTGKIDEAAKLYQELAAHATLTVPRATALLAMADAYRAIQPARARQAYEQIQKEFGSDTLVADAVKQEIAGLPPSNSNK